jgi:YkoY family integral membrane protein
MFGQTFAPGDLATIGLLVVLEGLLSIDNALVLGLIASRLAPELRGKALSYGLVGGFILRLVCIAAATILLRFAILKLIGAIYLLYIPADFFLKRHRAGSEAAQLVPKSGGLWPTIAAIELTDLAFAIDSILAAIALVGPAPTGSWIHPKFWVIATGGMLGIILMRFAAAVMARVMTRFPRLQRSAYLLVGLIGVKLLIDWAANGPAHPHRIDFQDPTRPGLWIFWACALGCVVAGLFGSKPRAAGPAAQ